jgi:D-aminopeptidase
VAEPVPVVLIAKDVVLVALVNKLLPAVVAFTFKKVFAVSKKANLYVPTAPAVAPAYAANTSAVDGADAGTVAHVLSPRRKVELLAVPEPRLAAGIFPLCRVVASLNVTPVPFSEDGISYSLWCADTGDGA